VAQNKELKEKLTTTELFKRQYELMLAEIGIDPSKFIPMFKRMMNDPIQSPSPTPEI
jgi:hypothetical protein